MKNIDTQRRSHKNKRSVQMSEHSIWYISSLKYSSQRWYFSQHNHHRNCSCRHCITSECSWESRSSSRSHQMFRNDLYLFDVLRFYLCSVSLVPVCGSCCCSFGVRTLCCTCVRGVNIVSWQCSVSWRFCPCLWELLCVLCWKVCLVVAALMLCSLCECHWSKRRNALGWTTPVQYGC